jgi:hypothetical protein
MVDGQPRLRDSAALRQIRLIAFDLDIDHLSQISRDGHPEIAKALRGRGRHT